MDTEEQALMGWQCPVCGAGNAPWKERCDCVPEPVTPTINPWWPPPDPWVMPIHPWTVPTRAWIGPPVYSVTNDASESGDA